MPDPEFQKRGSRRRAMETESELNYMAFENADSSRHEVLYKK